MTKSITKNADGNFVMTFNVSKIVYYKATFYPKHKTFRILSCICNSQMWSDVYDNLGKAENVIEFQKIINSRFN